MLPLAPVVVAVISAQPSPTAFTVPLEATLKTVGSETVHVNCAEEIRLPLLSYAAGVRVAESWATTWEEGASTKTAEARV
jgi:hypothetical protein